MSDEPHADAPPGGRPKMLPVTKVTSFFTVTPYALIDTSLQDSGPSRKKLVTLVTDGCNLLVGNVKTR